jgi:hypothetical protein
MKITISTILTVVAVIGLGLGVPPVLSAAPLPAAAQGFFITVDVTSNSFFLGQYDGEHIVQGDGKTILVPKIQAAPGFLAGIGWKWQKNAFEINFQRGDHDYTHLDRQGTSLIFNMINLTFSHYFSVQKTVQPFYHVDFGVFWMNVKNGATLDYRPVIASTATFTGLNLLSGGVGLAWFVMPRIAIRIGVDLRFLLTTDVYHEQSYELSGISTCNTALRGGLIFIL